MDITPDMLLRAYAMGIFPMAESADDPDLFWLEPKTRGIIPLDDLHISRRLARTVRSDVFTIRADHDFNAVIDGCAASADGRTSTWINARIRELYGNLFEMGHCHTIEAYDASGDLVGGLYGVRLGAAFFGESMFHRTRDASKVALIHLAARLKAGGFTLLDTQFVTPHLATFGAVEISRKIYLARLQKVLNAPANFQVWLGDGSIRGAQALDMLSGAGKA
jgi:leucyl/phenylalanyl-tRNA---protein transferase